MTWLRDLFRNPESEADPREWAKTAALHFLIGMGSALALGAVMGPVWGAVAASMIYAGLWELPQAYRSGLWWDCALDWCMWTLGCAAPIAVDPLGYWLVGAIIMLVGFEVRT